MSAVMDLSAVDLIMEYPFAQVREKLLSKGLMSPDIVDEAICEFRRYLVLISKGHPNLAMCSRDVDEVWHTFILFTSDYAAFCEEVFGSFLHHQPASRSRPLRADARTAFIEAYRQEFGDLPRIWATSANCSPNTGGGGNECSPTPSCSGEPPEK